MRRLLRSLVLLGWAGTILAATTGCPHREGPSAARIVDLRAVLGSAANASFPSPVSPEQPVYPKFARRSGVEGTVMIEIVVDDQGQVRKAHIIKSAPPFDGPSLDAVKKWHYRPYVLNGKAIWWKSTLTLRFKMRGPALPSTGSGSGPVSFGPATALSTTAGTPQVVQALDARPGHLFLPLPTYPRTAPGRSGDVNVDVIVGIEGRVVSASVSTGAAPFDAAALAEVAVWRFDPLTVDGIPRAWRATATLHFRPAGPFDTERSLRAAATPEPASTPLPCPSPASATPIPAGLAHSHHADPPPGPALEVDVHSGQILVGGSVVQSSAILERDGEWNAPALQARLAKTHHVPLLISADGSVRFQVVKKLIFILSSEDFSVSLGDIGPDGRVAAFALSTSRHAALASGGRHGASIGIGGDETDYPRSGSLAPEVIDAVIKRHLAQLEYCYERELPTKPTLAGRIVVHFEIELDGRVGSSSIKSSSLNDANVESCIADRFRTILFPKPNGGGIVTVNYPFLFKSGDGPEPPLPPPTDYGPIDVAIEVRESGVDVRVDGEVIADGCGTVDGLPDVLRALVAKHPDVRSVVVVAADGLPWSEVIRAADAVRDAGLAVSLGGTPL